MSAKLSQAHGAEVEAVDADLTKEADLERGEGVLANNPHVAMLVNNAGNGKLGSTVDMSAEEAASTIALNVTALTRLIRAVLPAFLSRNAGAIISIASVMALHSLAITSLYSGTKGFVLNFSRGLQEALAGFDQGEAVTLPSVHDDSLWETYDTARATLFGATQTGIPAPRYQPAARDRAA